MPRWSSTIRQGKHNALTTVQTAKRTGCGVPKFEERWSGGAPTGLYSPPREPTKWIDR